MQELEKLLVKIFAIADCDEDVTDDGLLGSFQRIMQLAKQALTLLRSQPEAGEFTKKFRDFIKLSEEHLSNNKIGRLRTHGLTACDLLDAQSSELKGKEGEIEGLKERLEKLTGERLLIDAYCRTEDIDIEQALKEQP